MRRWQILLAAGFLCAMAALAQRAGAPKVEIRGTIEKVQAMRGEGMPSLILRAEGKPERVLLGSMRYMLEQDFNPKAGEQATVRGFRVNDAILAITVTYRGKTVKFRDESGMPVWMRGRRGM
jgi:hypothetical protein